METIIEKTDTLIRKRFKRLKLYNNKQQFDSPEDLLSYYFKKNRPATVSVNINGSDPVKPKITTAGRNRSIPDLHSLCLHYFPDTTLERTLRILIDEVQKKSTAQGYCGTINRIVFCSGGYWTNSFMTSTYNKIWRTSAYDVATFGELLAALKEKDEQQKSNTKRNTKQHKKQ
jgi:hypothetical protein